MRNDNCKGILKGNFRLLRENVLDKSFKGVFRARVLPCTKEFFRASLSYEKWAWDQGDGDLLPCFVYVAPQEKVVSYYHPKR